MTDEANQQREAVLLPCPFCGGAFKMGQEPHDNHPVGGMFYIYHEYGPIGSSARKCPIRVERHFHTNAEAIAAWNTRSDARIAITRLRDALKIAREALLAELETPSEELVHVALKAWREHLRFHTTGDKNGEPVFKSTSHEAMTAALQAVAAHLKEQST